MTDHNKVVVSPLDIDKVIEALVEGHVVGLPTDTVYGLAASLGSPGALSRLFELKTRPAEVALPILIGSMDQIPQLTSRWPESAQLLADAFWPGPLTLVVPAVAEVGLLVGGDGSTVGIRWPDHSLVNSLCRRVGPLAVSSANRHGQPPCTTAHEVVESFLGQAAPGDPQLTLSVVVDGGRCAEAPSSVVDCTGGAPQCLREGSISFQRVQAELKKLL